MGKIATWTPARCRVPWTHKFPRGLNLSSHTILCHEFHPGVLAGNLCVRDAQMRNAVYVPTPQPHATPLWYFLRLCPSTDPALPPSPVAYGPPTPTPTSAAEAATTTAATGSLGHCAR